MPFRVQVVPYDRTCGELLVEKFWRDFGRMLRMERESAWQQLTDPSSTRSPPFETHPSKPLPHLRSPPSEMTPSEPFMKLRRGHKAPLPEGSQTLFVLRKERTWYKIIGCTSIQNYPGPHQTRRECAVTVSTRLLNQVCRKRLSAPQPA